MIAVAEVYFVYLHGKAFRGPYNTIGEAESCRARLDNGTRSSSALAVVGYDSIEEGLIREGARKGQS